MASAPKPPYPWKSEYAKSGRSSCKTCKSPIAKDALRLGKMVAASQFDGFMPVQKIRVLQAKRAKCELRESLWLPASRAAWLQAKEKQREKYVASTEFNLIHIY